MIEDSGNKMLAFESWLKLSPTVGNLGQVLTLFANAPFFRYNLMSIALASLSYYKSKMGGCSTVHRRTPSQ